MTTDLSTTPATEINAAHEAALSAVRSGLHHARRAGELLIEVKAARPHGEWLPWLAEHCPTISARTAQGYMRLARDWPRLEAAGNTQRVADLPLREALALLAEPDPSADAPELGSLEARIEAVTLGALATVGAALRRLRDGRLYRSTHADFDSYCRACFGVTGRDASRLIEAAGENDAPPVDLVSLDADLLGVLHAVCLGTHGEGGATAKHLADLCLGGALPLLAAPEPVTKADAAEVARASEPNPFRRWLQTAEALIQVRDRELYRGRYPSFEAYLVAEFCHTAEQAHEVAEKWLTDPVKLSAAYTWAQFYDLIPTVRFVGGFLDLESFPKDLPYETWVKAWKILTALPGGSALLEEAKWARGGQ